MFAAELEPVVQHPVYAGIQRVLLVDLAVPAVTQPVLVPEIVAHKVFAQARRVLTRLYAAA